MPTKIELSQINELSIATDYGGNRQFSSQSACTLLSVVNWLSNLDNWQGVGYELTVAEIDQIDEIVGVITDELLNDAGSAVSDYVKIAETSSNIDVANLSIMGMNLADYNTIKIVITGLRSDYTGSTFDHVVAKINNIATASLYNSFGLLHFASSVLSSDTLGTVAGLTALYGSLTTNSVAQASSDVEFTCYTPQSSFTQRWRYTTTSVSSVAGQLAVGQGNSWMAINSPLVSIDVTPYFGSNWLADIAGVTKPKEIKMTVYGVK